LDAAVVIDTSLPEVLTSALDDLLGIRMVECSSERVVLELPITERLHQGYGIVHGGVYATLAETAASIGAALTVRNDGGAVGTSNHTDFLRAVREGRLHAEATPVSRGRSLQLWQVDITDGNGRLVAQSKVKLYNLRARERAHQGNGQAQGEVAASDTG
jgi:1,4-dihydroxy-2-naphthoyl-CoA hydrolase